MQCEAKSKRTGERCKAQAITGKTVCRHHGGKTPVRHGLFSKFPQAVAAQHLEAARQVQRLDILDKTISLLAAILSLWVENGTLFEVKNAQATCALVGRLTSAVETYEKLTNPALRSGKLQLTHDYQNLSDAELIATLETLTHESRETIESFREITGETDNE